MSAISDLARASWRTPGFLAAVLQRLSGVALAIFLPMHFIVLGSSVRGAEALESYIAAIDNPAFKVAEWGLVTALSLHLALGIRILAIEWFGYRERGGMVVAAAFFFALAVGLKFLLGAGLR